MACGCLDSSRFTPRYLWCIMLTENGGLLVVPLNEEEWVRIAVLYEKSVSCVGDTFGEWFENEELESITIV